MKRLITLIALTAIGFALAETPLVVEPTGFITVNGSTSKNVSGLSLDATGNGLLVDDESNLATLVRYSAEASTLTATGAPRLISDELELDAEGVAELNGNYWVTGSHGISRKKRNFEPSRYQIVRLSKSGQVTGSGSLSTMFTSDAFLSGFFKEELQFGGINIEGLAALDGRLYAGLRSPNREGHAVVISFTPGDALSSSSRHDLHRLQVGRGNGIRGMCTTPHGSMLILVGPTMPSGLGPCTVWEWEPGGSFQFLAGLDKMRGKGEAIECLAAGSTAYEVMILSDGKSGGAPTIYRLPRSGSTK